MRIEFKPHEIAAALAAQARQGIEDGKDVAINAVGTRGWLNIAAIDYAGDGLHRAVGRYGQAEGVIFYIPSAALLAVSVGEPTA